MSTVSKESSQSSTSSSESSNSEGESEAGTSSSDSGVVDLPCKDCETLLQVKEDESYEEMKIALKSTIDQHIPSYTNSLILVHQSFKKAKIKLEKNRIKCKGRWYAGPDHIVIQLSSGCVMNMVQQLVHRGCLAPAGKVEFRWRIFHGEIAFDKASGGCTDWCCSQADLLSLDLQDADVSVVEGGESVKAQIIEQNGKVLHRSGQILHRPLRK
jgi:hypothetical protein